MIKVAFALILLLSSNFLFAQHIQYREKAIPVPATNANNGAERPNVPPATPKSTVLPNESKPVPAVKPAEKPEEISAVKSRVALNFNSKATKKPTELITDCFLSGRADRLPKLPLVINDVSPEMVAKLKERYKGRLYSITALNMTDVRLKYKLRICDKDMGKFRVEYLDEHGNVVNDPSLDYL